MAIRYEYIDTPKTTEDALTFMQHTLMPLIEEGWEKHGRQIYNEPLTFNVTSFVQMWMFGGLVVVAAYEGNQPVGYLFGIRFVPIPFKANVLQTEMWYGKTDEIEAGLFDYLLTIIKFMDIKEVRMTSDVHKMRELPTPWTQVNKFELYRYVKE